MIRWAWLLALAGCNQLFGLEETVPAGDRGLVTGVYKVRWSENDASGAATVRDSAYTVDELLADVVLDDGTRRDVTIRGDGTFSFPTAREGQAYSVTFRSAAGRNTFQLAVPDLVLVDRIAGRRDRALVPPNTELVYEVTDRPPLTLSGREEIMTTGIWTREQVTNDIPIRYDWSGVVVQSPPLGLLDGTKNDDAYYVQIDRASTFNRIVSAARTRATLVGGQSTTLTATAAPVDPALCTKIAIASLQERERLFALFPDASAPLALWAIHATPSAELGFVAALPIAFALASIDGADVEDTIDYGNPFQGGARILEFAMAVYRPAGDSVTVTMHVPVEADCTTTTTIAPGVAALPIAIEVAGDELTMKDQFVTIERSAPVAVTWQTSSSGAADYAVLTLFEQVDTLSVFKQNIYTAGNQALIDPADLEMGHKYFVQVQLRAGFPGGATGHYDTIEDAQTVGSMQSPTFLITN